MNQVQFRKVEDDVLSPEEMWAIASTAQPFDQVFQSEKAGHFNSGLFGRLYKAHPEHFKLIHTNLDPELVKYVLDNIEINPQCIDAMGADRMDEPIYAVTLEDEIPTFIIDGHHRIMKRALMGRDDLNVLIGDRWATEKVHVVKRSA